jgi:hypothetical protein
MRMRNRSSPRGPTHRYSHRPRPTQSHQAAPTQIQVRTGGRARCAAGDLLARSCARGVWRSRRGQRVENTFYLDYTLGLLYLCTVVDGLHGTCFISHHTRTPGATLVLEHGVMPQAAAADRSGPGGGLKGIRLWREACGQ